MNRAREGGAKPPVLLLHGEDDNRVSPRHSRDLAIALRAGGHSVEEKTYPGLDHADTVITLAKPLRGRASVLEDIASFLRRHDVSSRRRPAS